MTSPNPYLAAMTDFVLDRLDAFRAGDQQRIAELDALAPKDPETLAALWSAAFGIAERSLAVIASLDPAEAARTMQSFRDQVDEYRRG